MNTEEIQAANTINSAIETMAKMRGRYPKEDIQKFVKQWFVDGGGDPEYVLNVIQYIQNKKYQKTALNYLKEITEHGLVSEKSSPSSLETNEPKPLSKNSSQHLSKNDPDNKQVLEMSGDGKATFIFFGIWALIGVHSTFNAYNFIIGEETKNPVNMLPEFLANLGPIFVYISMGWGMIYFLSPLILLLAILIFIGRILNKN